MILFRAGRTGLTGKLLARLLRLKAMADLPNRGPIPLLIRWGNSTPAPPGLGIVRELNPAAAVRLATNKEQSLRMLAEKKIRVPKFVTSAPAIGRRRSHQQGTDIRIFEKGETLEGSDFYLEIIPSEKEFRVHVFKDEVLVTQTKVEGEERRSMYRDTPPPKNYTPIRNYDRGWRFKRIQNRTELGAFAISAVKALGLHFGAVDIIKDSRTGKYVVLEINTAPSLELTTLDRWVEAFKKDLRQ